MFLGQVQEGKGEQRTNYPVHLSLTPGCNLIVDDLGAAASCLRKTQKLILYNVNGSIPWQGFYLPIKGCICSA